jgi:hypothetical protein
LETCLAARDCFTSCVPAFLSCGKRIFSPTFQFSHRRLLQSIDASADAEYVIERGYVAG